jgi:hypothetical protein
MRRLAAVAMSAALFGSCGFAEKRDQADRIREAPDLLAKVGTAKTEFTVGLKVVASSANSGGISGGAVPPVVVAGDLDYAAHRASAYLALPGQEATEPVQLIDGTVLYQRRLAPVGSSPSRSQRDWRRIDLAALYNDRERYSRAAVGANFVGPTTLLDLVRGALTGSVEVDGEEEIRGVATTRYRLNVDLEKAFEDAPEELRESFAASREIGGMSRLVHPGRIWLDDDGLPRRVELRLRQERSRRDAIEVALVLDLFELGAPVTIAFPDDDEVSTVRDIASFVQASQ